MSTVYTHARTAATLTVILGGVFLWAGAMKAWRPDQFAGVIASITPDVVLAVVPPVWVAILLAAFEVSLGASLIVWGPERRLLRVCIGAIVVFSGALGVLAFTPGAPGCGCLGFSGSHHARYDALTGLGRNIALLWIAAWLLARRASAPVRARGMRARGLPGFTLIELLVTIAIIAIVLSIALPAMSGARTAARAASQVQTIRQLNAALTLYTGDNAGAFPYFATPGDPFGAITFRGFRIQGSYFQTQRWFWATVLVPDYYDAPPSSLSTPARREYLDSLGWPDFIVASDYQITSTAFAAWQFWREDDRASGGGGGPPSTPSWSNLAYLRGTNVSDVLFPSAKGLLLGAATGPGGPRLEDPTWPVAFADGSAQSVPFASFDQSGAVRRPFGAAGFPVESTRDGLHGRDF